MRSRVKTNRDCINLLLGIVIGTLNKNTAEFENVTHTYHCTQSPTMPPSFMLRGCGPREDVRSQSTLRVCATSAQWSTSHGSSPWNVASALSRQQAACTIALGRWSRRTHGIRYMRSQWLSLRHDTFGVGFPLLEQNEVVGFFIVDDPLKRH
jgi:hypothetical protein